MRNDELGTLVSRVSFTFYQLLPCILLFTDIMNYSLITCTQCTYVCCILYYIVQCNYNLHNLRLLYLSHMHYKVHLIVNIHSWSLYITYNLFIIVTYFIHTWIFDVNILVGSRWTGLRHRSHHLQHGHLLPWGQVNKYRPVLG